MMATAQQTPVPFIWNELNSIPDSTGFAGSFAGVSNNVLLVAGGSNFPDDGAPWLGSKKVWYDKIFALKSPLGHWKEVGRLPRSLGYGVSVTTKKGLVIIGGSNENGHYADVLLLQYVDDTIQIKKFPSLPVPLANTCGALVENKIYIAGGLREPSSKETKSTFFSLDLANPEQGWRIMPSLPGPSRMLAVAASNDKNFFLISGTQLINGQRVYLKDAYRYNEKNGWKRLKDIPSATVAAPSPAYASANTVYVFGGDDGSLAGINLKKQHPSFSSNIFSYDERKDDWTIIGKVFLDDRSEKNKSALVPVTTTMVFWNDHLIIPGGEIKPGIRTNAVLTTCITSQ